jgi:hypothetical protein
VKLPALVNTEDVTVTVLATEDIRDWTNAVAYPVDPATGISRPGTDPAPSQMFFKYSLSLLTDAGEN